MSVGKHRCTNCKGFFPPESMIVVTAGKFHSEQCKIDYAMKKTDKLIQTAKTHKKKQNARQKREYYDNDLKTRKNAAKLTCHAFIKLRDTIEAERAGIPLTCMCCDIPLIGKPAEGVHAGHFHESGNNPLIRYDEDNIHLQSGHCNKYKGGDSGNYRTNLIKKIGIDRVKRLDSLKGGTIKRTCEDYREIERYYKAKILELNKNNSNN